MKIVILDKKVHQNLALFRHLIHRQAEKRRNFFRVAQKSYQAYVNCKTGELQFAELMERKKLSKEWKPIIIQLRPNREGAFEVVAPDNETAFDYSEFSKEGYDLFSKTMNILNQVSFAPKHRRNPFWILRQVAHIDFLLSEEEEGRRNLIHEAWHDVDRAEAEHLLKGRRPGTYLFRKDEFATLLEDQLNEDLSKPVVCITLTFRDWENKITEKTLIFWKGKWSFYNDNVELTEPSFDTVQALLATMGAELSGPLFSEEG